MKITSSPASFLDPAAAGASLKGGAEYGAAFDSVIRTVAEETPKSVKPRKQGDESPQEHTKDVAEVKGKGSKAKPKEAAKAGAAETAGGAVSTEASPPAPSLGSATSDMLGRLLSGSSATTLLAAEIKAGAAASKDGGPAGTTPAARGKDGADKAGLQQEEAGAALSGLDEAIVVRGLDEAAIAAAQGEAAADGKVKLEVLHMETHFEPRSDAFVLVEGKAAAKAKPSVILEQAAAASGIDGAEETTAPVSFDEALQRLSAHAEQRQAENRDGDRREARQEARAAIVRSGAAQEADLSSGRGIGISGAGANAKDEAGLLPLSSMTGQVAGRVIDALAGNGAAASTADLPPDDAHLRMKAGGAALKTLSIQLQPENLGRLDVSMRLVEGQLTLELAATEADTARVLAADREGLRKLLQHAGFSLDDTSITIVTREASAALSLRGTPAEGGAAAQDGGSRGSTAGGGSPGGRDAQPGSQEGGSNRRGGLREDARPRAAPTGSSVYL